MTQKTFDFAIKGGLDLTTPPAIVKPGNLLSCKNYEPFDEGGIQRLGGYERYDGLPAPSDATYWFLYFDAGSGAEPGAEAIITGVSSGNTSELIDIVLTSGSWGVDAAGYLVVFNATGTYEDNEDLEVSATYIATADGVPVDGGGQAAAGVRAAEDEDDETYTRYAREARRDDISPVPGFGQIRGAFMYKGIVYAFRGHNGTNYNNTTISFTKPNIINDSGSGFGALGLSAGDEISITGGSPNDGVFTVATAVAGQITTVEETILTEVAGLDVSIGFLDSTKMFASSAASWVEVDLGKYIEFDTGTVEFNEGAILTGGTSGETATIVGVGVTSGSWSGGDAAGRLYITGVSGTFTNPEVLTDDGVGGLFPTGAGSSASSDEVVTIPPGGEYEFESYNFGGQTATNYLWAANSVGRAFRFDGTNIAFIHITGLSDALDKPRYIKPHKKQLFLAIGASLQHSAIGLPMVWNAIFGADELATGDDITGLQDQPGDILGIFNRNRTYLLYGDDVANWDLVNFSLERGAIGYSTQDLGWSIYADDRGIHTLRQTDQYGDLKMASISERIDPLYQRQKTKIIDSCHVRTKNQYRLFFSDKSGIICRFYEGNRREFTPFEYAHKVTTISVEEDLDGFERIFFGSTDGYVYEADKGESFDGGLIEYSFRLVFCHCGSARQKKRFRKVTFQIDAPDSVPLTFYPEFSYGNLDQPPQVGIGESPPEVNTGGGTWDTDFWGEFIWDGQLVGEAVAFIDGQGINVSLQVQGESNYERQHIFRSATYNFSMRGLRR